ncbi:hypothetical protein ACWCV9_36560 [Streptomyces sp. NPDC001606]
MQALQVVTAARPGRRVDGETAKISAWLAEGRPSTAPDSLLKRDARLVAVLFGGDRTVEEAVPVDLV